MKRRPGSNATSLRKESHIGSMPLPVKEHRARLRKLLNKRRRVANAAPTTVEQASATNQAGTVAIAPTPRAERKDPTRTLLLRRNLVTELKRKYDRLRLEIVQLLGDEDALGLAAKVGTVTTRQRLGLVGNEDTEEMDPRFTASDPREIELSERTDTDEEATTNVGEGGGTCKPGERADLTGCTPAKDDGAGGGASALPVVPKKFDEVWPGINDLLNKKWKNQPVTADELAKVEADIAGLKKGDAAKLRKEYGLKEGESIRSKHFPDVGGGTKEGDSTKQEAPQAAPSKKTPEPAPPEAKPQPAKPKEEPTKPQPKQAVTVAQDPIAHAPPAAQDDNHPNSINDVGLTQQLEDLSRQYLRKLPDQQRSALYDYTAYMHQDINASLWGGTSHGDVSADDATVRGYVQNLDAAIAGAPTLPEGTVVWRNLQYSQGEGVSNALVAKLDAAAKSGGSVKMKGFTSTSTKPFFGKAEGIHLRIKPSAGVYLDPVSAQKGEKEVLIPRGAEFKVAGPFKATPEHSDQEHTYYELEMVSHGGLARTKEGGNKAPRKGEQPAPVKLPQSAAPPPGKVFKPGDKISVLELTGDKTSGKAKYTAPDGTTHDAVRKLNPSTKKPEWFLVNTTERQPFFPGAPLRRGLAAKLGTVTTRQRLGLVGNLTSNDGTCKPGERADLTGCTPAKDDGGAGSTGAKPPAKDESRDAAGNLRSLESYTNPNPAAPDEARPPLSWAEARAAQAYSSDEGCHYVNDALRTGRQMEPQIERIHIALQGVFQRLQDFPKPITVFRSAGGYDAKDKEMLAQFQAAAKAGGHIKLKGYSSTTTNEALADNWGKRWKMQIEATRGLDMRSQSGAPKEDEILLDHATEFEVQAVEKGGPEDEHDWLIKLRQLPKAPIGNVWQRLIQNQEPPPADPRQPNKVPPAETRFYDTGPDNVEFLPPPNKGEPREPPTDQRPGTQNNRRGSTTQVQPSFPGASLWRGLAGRTTNTRWTFESNPRKVERFRAWLRERMDTQLAGDVLLTKYIQLGYSKGQARSVDEAKKAAKGTPSDLASLDKAQFLKQLGYQGATLNKIKLLAGRTLQELEGINARMSTIMTRILTDGLVRGLSGQQIAAEMAEEVQLAKGRVEGIVHTELVRAHAEGQLDAMQALGVQEVTAAVEWDTAGDGKVCKLCKPLDGVVLKLDEARGMIPRHPRCRCAWRPAPPSSVQELGKAKGQASRTKQLGKSLRAETGARSNKQAAQESRWSGADLAANLANPDMMLLSLMLHQLRQQGIIINAESFFAECDRDDKGHCLPGTGGGATATKDTDKAGGVVPFKGPVTKDALKAHIQGLQTVGKADPAGISQAQVNHTINLISQLKGKDIVALSSELGLKTSGVNAVLAIKIATLALTGKDPAKAHLEEAAKTKQIPAALVPSAALKPGAGSIPAPVSVPVPKPTPAPAQLGAPAATPAPVSKPAPTVTPTPSPHVPTGVVPFKGPVTKDNVKAHIQGLKATPGGPSHANVIQTIDLISQLKGKDIVALSNDLGLKTSGVNAVLAIKIATLALTGKEPSKAHVAEAAATKQIPAALKPGATSPTPAPAPVVPPPASTSAPSPTPTPKPVQPPSTTPSPSNIPDDIHLLKKSKELGGSTGAVQMVDSHGNKFVYKQGNNPGHLQEEMNADAAYRALGVAVPDSKSLTGTNGQPAKVSAWVEGKDLGSYLSDPSVTKEQKDAVLKEVHKGFVADALLGNWDVIGLNHDNIKVTPDGKVVRIDNGGSLRYRAQGALKPGGAFGADATKELASLLDPKVNSSSASVFKDIDPALVKQQIQDLASKKDQVLAALPKDLQHVVGQRIDSLTSQLHTPKPPDPGFTGKDALGREWVNGKLVPKADDLTVPHETLAGGAVTAEEMAQFAGGHQTPEDQQGGVIELTDKDLVRQNQPVPTGHIVTFDPNDPEFVQKHSIAEALASKGVPLSGVELKQALKDLGYDYTEKELNSLAKKMVNDGQVELIKGLGGASSNKIQLKGAYAGNPYSTAGLGKTPTPATTAPTTPTAAPPKSHADQLKDLIHGAAVSPSVKDLKAQLGLSDKEFIAAVDELHNKGLVYATGTGTPTAKATAAIKGETYKKYGKFWTHLGKIEPAKPLASTTPSGYGYGIGNPDKTPLYTPSGTAPGKVKNYAGVQYGTPADYDFHKQLVTSHGQYLESLPADLYQAAKGYTDHDYKAMNRALWDEPEGKPISAAMQKSIAKMDQLMAGAPPLPPGSVVWRDLGFSANASEVKELLARLSAASTNGTLEEFPGFTSTRSYNPLYGKALVKIKPTAGAYVWPLSSHDSERELLLPRGAVFKVTGPHPPEPGMSSEYYELEMITHATAKPK